MFITCYALKDYVFGQRNINTPVFPSNLTVFVFFYETCRNTMVIVFAKE